MFAILSDRGPDRVLQKKNKTVLPKSYHKDYVPAQKKNALGDISNTLLAKRLETPLKMKPKIDVPPLNVKMEQEPLAKSSSTFKIAPDSPVEDVCSECNSFEEGYFSPLAMKPKIDVPPLNVKMEQEPLAKSSSTLKIAPDAPVGDVCSACNSIQEDDYTDIRPSCDRLTDDDIVTLIRGICGVLDSPPLTLEYSDFPFDPKEGLNWDIPLAELNIPEEDLNISCESGYLELEEGDSDCSFDPQEGLNWDKLFADFNGPLENFTTSCESGFVSGFVDLQEEAE